MSILRSLSSRARVGEPPTASTFTSFEGEPAGFGDIGDEERRALVHRHDADGLSLEVGKRLDLGLRDDEVRGPLGDAGDDPKRAALVGLGDDAFDRGDCDLVRAGAQIVKDLFRAVIDLDRSHRDRPP